MTMENMVNYKNSRFGTRKIGWEYAIRGLKGRLAVRKIRFRSLYEELMGWLSVIVCVRMAALSSCESISNISALS